MFRKGVSRAAVVFAAFFITFAFPRPTRAQSTNAEIRGTVVDSNGGVLPGATVTAKNTETGLTRPSVTDDHGAFTLNALPPGTYTVSVELSGFATQNHPPMVLAIGQTATLRFTLQLASVKEAVTVTAQAPLVDVSKANLQMSVAPRDVDQLPLVGRQFMDLADLAPGVSIDETSANAGSDNVSFAGFGENFKSTWLEGMDINDEETNGGTGLSQAARFNLPLEAVQEFQVLSNSYSTEFGRSATGVINILTKSGTNAFHGRGFYYLRDHSFQKPNAFAKGNPPFREQQSGATLGGPIRQNKMWFFATFENQSLNDEVTVSVPSFVLPIITDPRTNVQQPTHNNTFFGKLTTSLSPNEFLNVIGLYGHDLAQNDSVGGTSAGDHGDNKLQIDKMLDASLTSVFGNNMTNSLRVLGSDGLKNRPPNGAISPEVVFPSITFGTASNFFQGRDQKNFTVMDTFNLHRSSRFGVHDFKFGGMINRVREIDTLDSNIHGVFQFLKDQLPVPGDPSTYPVLFEINQGNATLNLSPSIYDAFAEDAWQPTSNVTITMGVRYDLDIYNDNGTPPPPNISRQEFLTRFMLGDLAGNTYKPNPTDYGDVAPRIGLAWDPSHNGRTVIRAGWGMYFDRLSNTTRGSIIRQQPYYTAYQSFANDVRVTGIPNTFFPNLPDLSTLASAGSTRVNVPDPMYGIHTTYTKQTTAGLEQQLGSATSVSVDYVRMRGFHFPMTYNVNAKLPDGTYPIDPNGIVMNLNDLSNKIDSDQVQFTVKQRLKDRITFQSSYAYMRVFTFQSDPVNKQNPFSAENWGPSANDVRHRLVLSGAYMLPANFQVSGIVNWNSAPPYTITTGFDGNGDRDVNDRPIINGVMISPNSARGDRFFRTDVRVSKGFKFGKGQLDVLWEMNNIFNTINYGGYIGNQRSVNFGKPTYALTPFQGQLGIRYTF